MKPLKFLVAVMTGAGLMSMVTGLVAGIIEGPTVFTNEMLLFAILFFVMAIFLRGER
jgi:hypothetical protein